MSLYPLKSRLITKKKTAPEDSSSHVTALKSTVNCHIEIKGYGYTTVGDRDTKNTSNIYLAKYSYIKYAPIIIFSRCFSLSLSLFTLSDAFIKLHEKLS